MRKIAIFRDNHRQSNDQKIPTFFPTWLDIEIPARQLQLEGFEIVFCKIVGVKSE